MELFRRPAGATNSLTTEFTEEHGGESFRVFLGLQMMRSADSVAVWLYCRYHLL